MDTPRLDDLLAKIHRLEAELQAEVDRLLGEKRQRFRYTLERGRVRFEREVSSFQQRYRTALWSYLRNARAAHLLTAPIIYSVLVSLVMLDLFVTVYQQTCFRVYGIPRVRRGDYIVIDRQQLAYLNAIEKLNCMYCGYGNGLIQYVREVTARTEQYWCPIKHATRTLEPHRRESRFIDYGDAEGWHVRLEELRREWSDTEPGIPGK